MKRLTIAPDPVERAAVLTVLSLAGVLGFAALVTLLLRWADLWLTPLAATTVAASAVLIAHVRRR